MLMRAWRHLPFDAADNFAVFGSASIMALWQQITGNLFAVAVALTAVFLVVGGIVIMNIMLASVTERTREIGLRRSLGARKKHIVLQFMTESAVLAAVGRFDGAGFGLRHRRAGPRGDAHSGENSTERGDYLSVCVYWRRSFLWNLSRDARRQTGSD